jgi:hypothetical protein
MNTPQMRTESVLTLYHLRHALLTAHEHTNKIVIQYL